MYSSSYNVLSGVLAAGGMFTLVFGLVLIVCAIVAYFMAISLEVKAAKAKGHFINRDGTLWFIGLFTTPVVLGVIVAALPDRGNDAL